MHLQRLKRLCSSLCPSRTKVLGAAIFLVAACCLLYWHSHDSRWTAAATQLLEQRNDGLLAQLQEMVLGESPNLLAEIPPIPDRSDSDFVKPLKKSIVQRFLKYPDRDYTERVVILTPIFNVARLLPRYANLLTSLTYPRHLVSVVLGEDCSTDSTLATAQAIAADLRKQGFAKVQVFHFNISGQVTGHFSDIHNQFVQLRRRQHLAKSRNLLLRSGLKQEDWVVWLDSDVSFVPPDIIQQLLSAGKDIVAPACLYMNDEHPRVYDKNTWRETKFSLERQKDMRPDELMLEGYGVNLRLYLPDLRREGRVVPIDGVGGCTLLIRADLHRKGLIFPEEIIDHHIETEGLAKLAKRMNFGVYGMPFVEVIH